MAGWSEAARLLKMLRGRDRRGRPELWIRGQWSVAAFDTEDEYDDDDYRTNYRSGNGESLRPSERERDTGEIVLSVFAVNGREISRGVGDDH